MPGTYGLFIIKRLINPATPANAPTLYKFDRNGYISPSVERTTPVSSQEQIEMDRYNAERRQQNAFEKEAMDQFIRDILPILPNPPTYPVPAPVSQQCNRDYREATTQRPRDPLAIDLDGDGIETVGIPTTGTPILFDHDANGVKTGTGWLKGDDAWLVMDRDGNGTIDSGRELFGVDTQVARYSLSNGVSLALRRLVWNATVSL
jgi:hypothetical protein